MVKSSKAAAKQNKTKVAHKATTATVKEKNTTSSSTFSDSSSLLKTIHMQISQLKESQALMQYEIEKINRRTMAGTTGSSFADAKAASQTTVTIGKTDATRKKSTKSKPTITANSAPTANPKETNSIANESFLLNLMRDDFAQVQTSQMSLQKELRKISQASNPTSIDAAADNNHVHSVNTNNDTDLPIDCNDSVEESTCNSFSQVQKSEDIMHKKFEEENKKSLNYKSIIIQKLMNGNEDFFSDFDASQKYKSSNLSTQSADETADERDHDYLLKHISIEMTEQKKTIMSMQKQLEKLAKNQENGLYMLRNLVERACEKQPITPLNEHHLKERYVAQVRRPVDLAIHYSMSDKSTYMDDNAVLSHHPRSLFLLWDEWVLGINDNKPAHLFNRAERGRSRFLFSKRKVFWDRITNRLKGGRSVLRAIQDVYDEYGREKSVTEILVLMRADRNKTKKEQGLKQKKETEMKPTEVASDVII